MAQKRKRDSDSHQQATEAILEKNDDPELTTFNGIAAIAQSMHADLDSYDRDRLRKQRIVLAETRKVLLKEMGRAVELGKKIRSTFENWETTWEQKELTPKTITDKVLAQDRPLRPALDLILDSFDRIGAEIIPKAELSLKNIIPDVPVELTLRGPHFPTIADHEEALNKYRAKLDATKLTDESKSFDSLTSEKQTYFNGIVILVRFNIMLKSTVEWQSVMINAMKEK